MKVRNLIFSVVFLAVIIGTSLFVIFLKPVQEVSLIENRNLNTFDKLKTTTLNGSFQDGLEKALADQFIFRYDFVTMKKKLDYESVQLLFNSKKDEMKLNLIGETNVAQVGSSRYMVNWLLRSDKEIEQRFIDRFQQINNLQKDHPEVEVYVYKPTQIHEVSFFDEYNDIDSAGKYYNQLFEEYLEVPYAKLEIPDLETYKQFFYSSDHHWNHQGSYQGYKDIMKLLFKDENEILEPTALDCKNGLTFYGTFSHRTSMILSPSDFCVYSFDIEPYEVIMEGVPQKIRDTNTVFQMDPYKMDPQAYQYGDTYDEYGPFFELHSQHPEKPSILIVGDSYTAPVLPLLIENFSTIYYINPLTYHDLHWENLKYDTFMREHEVDKVLFMYTIENYFFSDTQWGDRYKSFDINRE